VTISSWLNFGRPAFRERGSAVERKFLDPPYYSQRAVFASPLSAFSFRLKSLGNKSTEGIKIILIITRASIYKRDNRFC